MRKRIPLEQLTVGMYVAGLDMSWLESPFFRHRMKITQPEQIAQLKASRVRYVEIEPEKGLDWEAPLEAASQGRSSGEILQAGPSSPADQPAQEPEPVSSQAPASFEEEMETAKKIYKDAKNIVERAMHDVRMGREINMDVVSKVVDGLADSVLRNVDALTSLSRLKSFDEYTFFHSVNTSVLALAMGQSLEMDRNTIHLLGTGTLLHDIGKTKIPLKILNKPGRLDESEFEIIKQHTLRGAPAGQLQEMGRRHHVLPEGECWLLLAGRRARERRQVKHRVEGDGNLRTRCGLGQIRLEVDDGLPRVLQPPWVLDAIQGRDARAPGQQRIHQVGADESGRPCHQHRCALPVVSHSMFRRMRDPAASNRRLISWSASWASAWRTRPFASGSNIS